MTSPVDKHSEGNPPVDAKSVLRPSQILDESSVALNMKADTKQAVVAQLVELLAAKGVVTDTETVLRDIRAREQVMSTGIGGGIAVPHAQSTGAGRLALALGRPAAPIDFDALDGRPVELVFLLVGPDERGGFIRILARISRLLYSGDLQRNLLLSRTAEDAMGFIRAAEQRIER